MQANTPPVQIVEAFAINGNKNVIPVPSQIGVSNGAASYNDGFPPLTSQPLAAGGVPPDRLDFNGILNSLSQTAVWAQAGGGYIWNSVFAAAIGGYPKGAILMSSFYQTTWLNTVDNNLTNPDSNGAAGWVRWDSYGVINAPMNTGNLTLVGVELGAKIVKCFGALTANTTLFLPPIATDYLIVNACSGPFTLTVAMTGGGGVVIPQGGAAPVLVDGANAIIATAQPTASQAASGIIQLATQAIVNALTNGLQAVTPATLGAGFSFTNSGSRWALVLPQWLGSIIINGGTTGPITARSTSPVTFTRPYASLATFLGFQLTAQVSDTASSALASAVPILTGSTVTGLTVTNPQAITTNFNWWSIGQ